MIGSALDYHRETSYVRHRIKGHHLDFDHYPIPVKPYDFPVKVDIADYRKPGNLPLEDLFNHRFLQADMAGPDFKTLSSILFYAYGVTRSVRTGRIGHYYRTVPSAGGLYPCHLYLLAQGVTGLETGLYYCDMIQKFFGLIQKTEKHDLSDNGISFIITGQFYNSAWKYQERAYRYILLDAGHLIENISLSMKSHGVWPTVSTDMDDDAVSQMLSVDTTAEVPVAVVSAGKELTIPAMAGEPAESVSNYPVLASTGVLKRIWSLGKQGPVAMTGEKNDQRAADRHVPGAVGLDTFDVPEGILPYDRAVFMRSSKRKFTGALMEKNVAMQLLSLAASFQQSRAKKQDNPETDLRLGMACENTEGFEDGVYHFSSGGSVVHPAMPGQYHHRLARVCLDQMWMARASVHFLFMADLGVLEKRRGPRGYRALLMEAGRVAQRIYLGAAALGLGCCAVGALYDEEARVLLNLQADDSLIYVVSTGLIQK